MPEESIETHELKEQLEESAEHARGHHGEGPKWTLYLSLSTAFIAVFAAVGALQSSANESRALLAKNEAILAQSKATDAWAYFQAKGTKAAIYEVAAEGATPEAARKFDAKREQYKNEQDEIGKQAKELENEVKEHDERGEDFFEHHHVFALSVTIFQVSIALSAIAALTRRRLLWYGSMLVGISGVFFFARGFLS